MPTDGPPTTRRALLASLGTTGLGSFAGCTSVLSPDRRRWSYDHDGEQYGGPLLAGDTVLLGTRSDDEGTLHALDAGTGERRWRVSTPATRGGVVATDGLYVVGTTAGVVAVDPDGTERWRALGGAVVSGVDATPDTVYVATARGAVVALDHGEGGERWRVEPDPEGPIVAGREALVVVVASDTDGGPETALVGLDPNDGTERWREPFAARIPAFVRVRAGRLYTAGEEVVVRDLADGQAFWSFPVGFREEPSTVPLPVGPLESVYVGTGVFFSDRDYGTVYSLSEGEPGYEFRTEDTVTELAGDIDGLFALVDGTLHAVDPESMAGRWSVDLGRPLSTPVRRAQLVAREGVCFAALDTGRLVAFADD